MSRRFGLFEREIAARAVRLKEAIGREGMIDLARRKAAQAAAAFGERSTVRQFRNQVWQPDGRPVFLLVRHNAGGGTERHVREMARGLAREGARPILVRPGSGGRLIWEEPSSTGEIAWCRRSAPDRDSIEQLLALIAPVFAHVHHLSGIPGALIELLRSRGIPYDWTIHDYHAICPRIHLIGTEGIYCGEPDAAGCNACLGRLGDDNGNPVHESITAWRARFRTHLSYARRVVAPSEDVARRIRQYVPGLNLVIRPHPEHPQYPGVLARKLALGESARAVVIGTIVRTKGSERLLACAEDARDRRLPLEFRIIGTTDRNAQFRRLKNVSITGRYRETEVFDLLAAASAHVAFLPTVCPESFMYTLSAIMAAGFYTVAYDIGAQAERLRAWGWAELLPLEAGASAINQSLLAAARRVAAEPSAAPPVPPGPAVYPGLLQSYYGFSSGEIESMALRPAERPAGFGATPHRAERKAHARLH